MPDFEKRLQDEFDLKKTKHVWVDAWDLTHASTAKNEFSDPASSLMKLLEKFWQLVIIRNVGFQPRITRI